MTGLFEPLAFNPCKMRPGMAPMYVPTVPLDLRFVAHCRRAKKRQNFTTGCARDAAPQAGLAHTLVGPLKQRMEPLVLGLQFADGQETPGCAL